ncbi:hypothetical protein Tsubulata_000094 [Turnera subulata]|uniref:non-specific serine/threonine protein kinase n=1 Tax=Turnera subulata TaxID=218843 RepID=A0A9Q0FJB2_9ROSI|nr:hypothetical protein Tsubulata_000094 [Turnera subulata]
MKMLRMRACGCIFAVSCCYLVLFAAAQVTNPTEVTALTAVKSSAIDPLKHLGNWGKGDPCISNWTGVFCYDTVGPDGYLHVRELQLLNMNLSGTLVPELGLLSYLEILDFMWNNLTGSIPKEIGNISSLKLLLLNGNKLSGSLPVELGYLTNLNRLQVDQNQISGLIPTSFANLSSVKHLHMNNNSFSGQIPPELSNCSALIHLLLDNNNLSGYLPPELSNLPLLRILQLDNNNFSGSGIPATYGNISRLAKLSLRNCSLQGEIPDLTGIPHLYYLDLSRNDLTGPIPSKLGVNVTTIKLSNNHLNGSIPGSFSNLPFLQRLSLQNNLLTGSVPANIWRNMFFSSSARLILDLRNNSLSNVSGVLNPPENVTLRLSGNPICKNGNIPNIIRFCGTKPEGDWITENLQNSTSCPVHACPTDDFFEYVPVSPEPCFCAAPLRIGYRLKSPSFSYFPPHKSSFEAYVTGDLNLDLYELSVDSYFWEEGPRLRMYLKLFPSLEDGNTFNETEVQRIRGIFTSWRFSGSDFFGPYELLNFTLWGPYSQMNFESQGTKISKGVLAAIVLGAIASIVALSSGIALLILRRNERIRRKLSRKRLSSRLMMKIEGVKDFTFKEMVAATDNFNISTQVGQGGYGKVYKGILPDKKVVAIKRAEEGSLQGQKEFLTEIKLLSRLHHRNLVSLIGYCDEEGEQMLVYEFMPNGTLRDWLSAKNNEQLNFVMRLNVALDSAKGILYLHTEANPPVFHRDIKATNILLDFRLTAKVADFGLSRLAPVLDDEGNLPNHVSTVVKGTPVNLSHQSGMMFSIIDSRMGSYPSECVERFVALALRCCHEQPDKRPSMLDVVRELENIRKMMPETDVVSPESTSAYTSGQSVLSYSGQSASSSSFYTSRETYRSSSLVGSDLASDVIPTITPR